MAQTGTYEVGRLVGTYGLNLFVYIVIYLLSGALRLFNPLALLDNAGIIVLRVNCLDGGRPSEA